MTQGQYRKMFKSIDQRQLADPAKKALKSFKDATDNFKDSAATAKLGAKFVALYDKIKAQKPQAISGHKAPAKAPTPVQKKAATKAVSRASATLSVSARKRIEEAKKNRRAQGLSTAKENIMRDAGRPALPKGRRVSKEGNEYYEYRENRIDRKPQKFARLEKGGKTHRSEE